MAQNVWNYGMITYCTSITGCVLGHASECHQQLEDAQLLVILDRESISYERCHASDACSKSTVLTADVDHDRDRSRGRSERTP
jgi:hypothetical protein